MALLEYSNCEERYELREILWSVSHFISSAICELYSQ